MSWTGKEITGSIAGVDALRIITGDATSPPPTGPRIIAHICNDLGRWGKGFVLAVSRRWPEPAQEYRAWHRARARNDFQLGATQFVSVGADLWVANMIAQHGIRTVSDEQPPIRYDALARCLDTVADRARRWQASVHMPRIRCGLAGGTWDRIEPIIVETLLSHGVATTIYDPG